MQVVVVTALDVNHVARPTNSQGRKVDNSKVKNAILGYANCIRDYNYMSGMVERAVPIYQASSPNVS